MGVYKSVLNTPVRNSLLSDDWRKSLNIACDLFLNASKEELLDFLEASDVITYIIQHCNEHAFGVFLNRMKYYNISINYYINGELTLLHKAVLLGNVHIVEYLIRNGANTMLPIRNHTLFASCTMMHLAAQVGNIQIMRSLFQKSKLNEYDKFGFTPLHYAVKNGHLDCVQYLVQQGARINKPVQKSNNEYGVFTPIELSILFNRMQIFECLIKKGAKLVSTSKPFLIFIHNVKKNQDCGAAKILIENKCTFDLLIAYLATIGDNKSTKIEGSISTEQIISEQYQHCIQH